jgi:hypothetical protein
MQRLTPRHSTVVAYLALFAALSTGAYALTTSSGSRPIRACYAKRGGDLRILLHGNCRNGEKLVKWNRKGIQGPPGPSGPATGPAGGALAGNFPNPQLASGAVRSANFAPSAQAPDSAALGGQPPSAYAASSLFGNPPPQLSNSGGDNFCVLGEIKLSAGDIPAVNWHLADGSLLPTSMNSALYALLGNTYGGDSTNFALPDLRGAEPKGRGPAGVNYFICTAGTFP